MKTADSWPQEGRRWVRPVCISLAVVAGLVIVGFMAAVATVHLATKRYNSLRGAVASRDAFAVRCFLLKGADVNDVVSPGWIVTSREPSCVTHLHVAAVVYAPDVAALLIAAGADVNAKDSYGSTPLDYAVMAGANEIVELLRAHAAIQTREQDQDEADLAQ